MLATATGILVPERTLTDPRRGVMSSEVDPAWFKVTKSGLAHSSRFTVTQRASSTKTQSSPDAPEYLQIPLVQEAVPRPKTFEDSITRPPKKETTQPGWGATSQASPTWMTTLNRDHPERKPYLTAAYAGGTHLLEDTGHESRPTWSQAPVMPSPAAAAHAKFAQYVRPNLAAVLLAKADTSFDDVNGTALTNPFLSTHASSASPNYKTGVLSPTTLHHSPGGHYGGVPVSPSATAALTSPLSPVARPSSSVPSLGAFGSGTGAGTGAASPLARGTFGTPGGRFDGPSRSPLSPTGGEVVRVTTPSSRADLFSRR